MHVRFGVLIFFFRPRRAGGRIEAMPDHPNELPPTIFRRAALYRESSRLLPCFAGI